MLGAAILIVCSSPPALAASRIYWGNGNGSTPVSFANLDGSGGGDLNTTGVGPSNGLGVAIDPAAGRIYWSRNDSTHTVAFANLDGSGGGGELSTAGASAAGPVGAAIDPAAGKIAWTDQDNNAISFANLNGSGGGTLPTSPGTVNGPTGVTIDPAAGRIYWANQGSNTNPVSFAKFDGSGGGDLTNIGSATPNMPSGVAIDSTAGRIYWANYNSTTTPISFANLDGSGGGDLNTSGATADQPYGVAIDPAAGRIYWANFHSTTSPISFANLDGSGGGNLPTSGATPLSPIMPALLEPPSGAGAPQISGGSAFGSALSCSLGSWADDLLPSLLYRAPQSFAYQWSRDGAEIAGATTSSITASSPGTYTCRVTAINEAGSTSQTSPGQTVASSNAFGFGKVKLNKRKGTAILPVVVPGAGTLTLTGSGVVKQRPVGARRAPSRVAKVVAAAGTVKLLVKTKGKAKRKLDQRGSLKVKVKVFFTPTGGVPAASQTKTIRLKKTL